ncbi:MAG: hypothetical protein U0X39_14050 [Bacteroidales bacterium]
MKKLVFILALIFTLTLRLNAQSGTLTGKPIVEIFTDFKVRIADDSKKTGFSLSRAYFGYNFMYDDNYSATLTIDAGNPEDLAPGSKSRRYAHFREASVTYKTDRLNITAGITGTKIFAFQQKFWGKRYVANTYQSINGYGFVADLGVVATYKFNDKVEGDISVMNGEGYSTLQLDENVKFSYGMTFTPDKNIAIRLYSDLLRKNGLYQNTLVGFAGYKNEHFYIGAELSYKSNLDLTEGHHAWGFSSTGGVMAGPKTEIFTRFDYSTSVIIAGTDETWNHLMDGNFFIAGVQHTFNPVLKMALDYQNFFPVDNSRNTSKLIYLNALFKF